MVGIVVVTHGMIGVEMVAAARKIFPEATHLIGVAVAFDEPLQHAQDNLRKAIERVREEEGVLLLTDMFGGTPSNFCLSFLSEPKTELVSGVNLPMLVKLANVRKTMSLSELTQFIQEYGQRNIVVARR